MTAGVDDSSSDSVERAGRPFDEPIRIESGRPEQAMIEAELALIASDVTARVEPDPGEVVTVDFFCNLKPEKEIALENEQFARLYPDHGHSDLDVYDAQTWTVVLRSDLGGAWFDVRGDEGSAEYRVERMVDVFQDLVTDATWVARPRCPPHPHPMVLRSDGSVARWACPKSESIRCDIGGYRAFAEQSGLTILAP